MSRLLKLAALLLAALWLPATLHCRLENLGLDALFACADQPGQHEPGEKSACADDGCQTVESGQVLLAKGRLDAPAPALLVDACAFCLCELSPPDLTAEFPVSRQGATLPLQRTWQFAHRAAAPPRAPSLAG